jgi:hypothetical protein
MLFTSLLIPYEIKDVKKHMLLKHILCSKSVEKYKSCGPRAKIVVVGHFELFSHYLRGTATNIWLRPVEEDLSMTACFEHSASNL